MNFGAVLPCSAPFAPSETEEGEEERRRETGDEDEKEEEEDNSGCDGMGAPNTETKRA